MFHRFPVPNQSGDLATRELGIFWDRWSSFESRTLLSRFGVIGRCIGGLLRLWVHGRKPLSAKWPPNILGALISREGSKSSVAFSFFWIFWALGLYVRFYEISH